MRVLLLTLFVVACGGSPEPTGTVCPDPDPMTLTYDKGLIPAGHTENDVRTFYYAEELHRWEQVGIVGEQSISL